MLKNKYDLALFYKFLCICYKMSRRLQCRWTTMYTGKDSDLENVPLFQWNLGLAKKIGSSDVNTMEKRQTTGHTGNYFLAISSPEASFAATPISLFAKCFTCSAVPARGGVTRRPCGGRAYLTSEQVTRL